MEKDAKDMKIPEESESEITSGGSSVEGIFAPADEEFEATDMPMLQMDGREMLRCPALWKKLHAQGKVHTGTER